MLPPYCNTFSKARDRGSITRVISTFFPAGLHPKSKEVKQANIVARRTIQMIRWVVAELNGIATLENPDKSYLWLYGAPWFGSPKSYRDVRLSYCMYGTRYQKHTRFR